jgi:hypothetical protein
MLFSLAVRSVIGMNAGARLVELGRVLNLEPKDLAPALGVSLGAIRNYSRTSGKYRPAKRILNRMIDLAALAGVHVDLAWFDSPELPLPPVPAGFVRERASATVVREVKRPYGIDAHTSEALAAAVTSAVSTASVIRELVGLVLQPETASTDHVERVGVAMDSLYQLLELLPPSGPNGHLRTLVVQAIDNLRTASGALGNQVAIHQAASGL